MKAGDALEKIQAYVSEAAKTPITRDRIAATTDPEALRLLAYSQFDEMQGLCRLVQSEIDRVGDE